MYSEKMVFGAYEKNYLKKNHPKSICSEQFSFVLFKLPFRFVGVVGFAAADAIV